MALFQEAIIRKHLLNLDEEVIDSAYREYKRVYSTEKIKNIRVAKEEQYQEGFIKEIFGSVLGYSVYPESPYNIETEKKNETNSRKADGAILKEDKVIGVIELKDNKTKNLDAVKDQAFGYKNNHKECSYVISSNFHKLRFYIDDATDYEEFDLYNLDKETFKRFYLYLRKEGLLDKNIPKLLRQETKFHEEEISKKLYKDYSNFKGSFFENALKNNPQFDRLALFKKSQKFLDRVLFVLFAEDKGLISTNSVVQIVEKWQALRDDAFDTPRPLYALVLLFFNNLYLGKKDNKGTVLIPEFGGELFAPDDVLDQLTIDDDVLKDDLLKLSKYDFNTDVDVNILGHIFEHSLNEVDDVEAELRGEQLDKTKSKRKKDGVFYTPKYITKYIVDNTLGKLCSDKKSELKLDIDIFIDDFQKMDGKLNEKGKDLFERLNIYKSWLLTVKVCDPACGSGAFLNQALSFFIEEHKFVNDLIAELTNSPLRLFDTDLQILENNIYGVDINEESVEIAKLSMWLRTAQPGRKLSNLSNNIKCGNSLIDDPEVAGDKAFNWGREFPSVFIEKNKFAFHITTSLHDSRTSSRMLEFKVRERRFDGSKPNAEVNPLTKEEEELIATTVSEIAKEDDLKIAAFNLCRDHMHILLVCEEAEISSIMQKIKAKTARAVNILRGITKVVEHGQTSPNKGACSLDEIRSADSRNKGACSLDEKERETSPNKGACSLDETERETSRNKGAGSLDDTENTGSPNKGACSLDDSSAVHRIDRPRGEKQNSLWTQKFGCKPIVSDEQFWNTFHYIENNKEKHNLPRNPKLETIISRFVKTYEECLKTEYTGGFDVVIGNPPYVRIQNLDYKVIDWLKENKSTAHKRIDISTLFIEESFKLVNDKGLISFITSNQFFKAEYGRLLRGFLKGHLILNLDFSDVSVFEGLSTYVSILTFSRQKSDFIEYYRVKDPKASFENIGFKKFDFDNLDSDTWDFSSNNTLFGKIYKDTVLLGDCADFVYGIITGNDLSFIVDKETFYQKKIEKEVSFDFVKPENYSRYLLKYLDKFIIYPYDANNNVIPESEFKIKFPNAYNYLLENKSILENRMDSRFTIQDKGLDWYVIMRRVHPKDILEPKILFFDVGSQPNFYFDNSGLAFGGGTSHSLTVKKNIELDTYFLLSLLNSKLLGWIINEICPVKMGGARKYGLDYMRKLPIKIGDKDKQNEFKTKARKIIESLRELQDINQKFINYFTTKFGVEKSPTKLMKWYDLDFDIFLKELNKILKVRNQNPLSTKDEFEWMELFEENKKKALELKSQIDQTDKEIDRMVYALYGLTEEEIQIVENS